MNCPPFIYKTFVASPGEEKRKTSRIMNKKFNNLFANISQCNMNLKT